MTERSLQYLHPIIRQTKVSISTYHQPALHACLTLVVVRATPLSQSFKANYFNQSGEPHNTAYSSMYTRNPAYIHLFAFLCTQPKLHLSHTDVIFSWCNVCMQRDKTATSPKSPPARTLPSSSPAKGNITNSEFKLRTR